MTDSQQGGLIVVVGPTACGKSDLAILLAQQLRGEVVNADAFQIYRGMDIGTAKVLPGARAGVPHHLIDVFDINESVSVAQFQQAARAAIGDIQGRGKVAVLVGGSGLYVRAVVDDLRFPGTDPIIRAQLESDLLEVGPELMHRRLQVADPVAAEAIASGNGRRIVRALEVIAITGAPFVASMPDALTSTLLPHTQVGIDIDRPTMDARIDARVGQMWTSGLIEEVRMLEAKGLREAPTAGRALGYPQALAQLDGVLTEAAAQDATASATRSFARRQQRWFRQDPRITWIPFGPPAVMASAFLNSRVGLQL